MTHEDKQLLLKDICARLPYGIKFPYHIDEDSNHRECDCVATMDTISEDTVEFTYEENGKIRDWSCIIEEVRPYLRPMSSITEEENKTIDNISNKGKGFEEDEDGWIRCDSIHTKWGVWPDGCAKLLDYLNSIHIDYRGLIERGLALEAPEGMYKQ